LVGLAEPVSRPENRSSRLSSAAVAGLDFLDDAMSSELSKGNNRDFSFSSMACIFAASHTKRGELLS